MEISGIGSKLAMPAVTLGQGGKGDGFQNVLSDAIEAAGHTDAADKASAGALLAGGSDDLHEAVLATEKADIALRLTVQIRNKVLDAYNEVMRMQV